MPAPVFPVATNLIRPAPIQTVIPVEPKVKPEPVPVTPIIEKPETLKPVEKVGKPGTLSLSTTDLFFSYWGFLIQGQIHPGNV